MAKRLSNRMARKIADNILGGVGSFGDLYGIALNCLTNEIMSYNVKKQQQVKEDVLGWEKK